MLVDSTGKEMPVVKFSREDLRVYWRLVEYLARRDGRTLKSVHEEFRRFGLMPDGAAYLARWEVALPPGAPPLFSVSRIQPRSVKGGS